MARTLALLAASALTACSAAPPREAAGPRRASTETTKAASVDPDPCALPIHLPSGARAEIEPLPFQLASLHVGVVVADADRFPGRPEKMREPEALDLSVRPLAVSFRPAHEERSVEIVPKKGFGEIQVGAVPATFECGAASEHAGVFVGVHYTTLVPDPSGSAEYIVGDALFDPGTCKTMLLRRTSVQASPIAGGLVYAIRETPEEGATPDRLTLLFPVALRIFTEGFSAETAVEQIGRISRLSVPLTRGGGGSVTLAFDTAVLDSWISGGAEVDARAAHQAYGEELTVGIEVTQAVGDPEPVGLAYLEKSNAMQVFARARLFRCVEPEATAAKN